MREKATTTCRYQASAVSDTAESKNLCMRGNSKRENREILSVSAVNLRAERSENVSDGKADMNARRKSDGSVVPAKPANNGAS